MTNNLISQIEREEKAKKVAKIVAIIALAVAVIFFVVKTTATDTPNPPQPPIDEGMSIEEMMAMIRARRAAHKPTTTSSTLTGKDGQTSGGWDAPIDVATPGKYQAGSIGNTEETKKVVVKGEAPSATEPVEEEKVRTGHKVVFHSNSGQFEISFQDVVTVLVDGVELPRSAWTIKSNGNLEINLKDYDTNEHVLKVWWDDGSAKCTFYGKKEVSIQSEEASGSASESTDNEVANESTTSEDVSNENSAGSEDNTSSSSDNSGNSSTTSEEASTGNETGNGENSEDTSGENSNEPIENGHVEYDPGF